jgi:hypothetical protein
MKKKDELVEPNSCLNKAHDDELVFVLLERDVAAPAAVKAWIDKRLKLGKNQPSDPQIEEAWKWIEAVKAKQLEKIKTVSILTYEELQAMNEKAKAGTLLSFEKKSDTYAEATIGKLNDGVTFSISHMPTCYRRGPYRLLIEIHVGVAHNAWGCFDDQDQPMRYFHQLNNLESEAAEITRVLVQDRIKNHAALLNRLPT